MTDLVYQPPKPDVAYDSHAFDLSHYGNHWQNDIVNDLDPLDDLVDLAKSGDWQDRLRAEMLRNRLKIVLPPQFPCIYEVPESPNLDGRQTHDPAWVVSPDVDMLNQLLPDYQELWDCYTAVWGPTSRRLFAVGWLDGIKPHRVYRPGTTPADVIGNTMLIHTDMYARASERLQAMHPRKVKENTR